MTKVEGYRAIPEFPRDIDNVISRMYDIFLSECIKGPDDKEKQPRIRSSAMHTTQVDWVMKEGGIGYILLTQRRALGYASPDFPLTEAIRLARPALEKDEILFIYIKELSRRKGRWMEQAEIDEELRERVAPISAEERERLLSVLEAEEK